MGLVKCRECNKEVSENAQTCPYCGVKNPSSAKANRSFWIKIILLALLLGGIGYGYLIFTKKDEIKNKVKSLSHEEKEAAFSEKATELKADSKDLVIEMLKEGKSVREVSKATGVRKDEVRKIKRELKKQGDSVSDSDEEE